MKVQPHPIRDVALDVGLFAGTILAIFIFGLAALPSVHPI